MQADEQAQNGSFASQACLEHGKDRRLPNLTEPRGAQLPLGLLGREGREEGVCQEQRRLPSPAMFSLHMAARLVGRTRRPMRGLGCHWCREAPSDCRMFTARARTSVSRTLEETGGAITGLSPAGAGALNTARQPTSQQLRQLFIHAAIPMVRMLRRPPLWRLTSAHLQRLTPSRAQVGFGLMDNTVMIQVGDYIDGSLGVMLGLNTLTAAAMGQVGCYALPLFFLPAPSCFQAWAIKRTASACERLHRLS